jgi:hypothetical protein
MIAEQDNPTPLNAANNGRRSNGQFGSGNKAGKGNGRLKKIHEMRREFEKVASEGNPSRFRRVIEACFDAAENGDTVAQKEVFDRLLGKSNQPISLDEESIQAVKILAGVSMSDL